MGLAAEAHGQRRFPERFSDFVKPPEGNPYVGKRQVGGGEFDFHSESGKFLVRDMECTLKLPERQTGTLLESEPTQIYGKVIVGYPGKIYVCSQTGDGDVGLETLRSNFVGGLLRSFGRRASITGWMFRGARAESRRSRAFMPIIST